MKTVAAGRAGGAGCPCRLRAGSAGRRPGSVPPRHRIGGRWRPAGLARWHRRARSARPQRRRRQIPANYCCGEKAARDGFITNLGTQVATRRCSVIAFPRNMVTIGHRWGFVFAEGLGQQRADVAVEGVARGAAAADRIGARIGWRGEGGVGRRIDGGIATNRRARPAPAWAGGSRPGCAGSGTACPFRWRASMISLCFGVTSRVAVGASTASPSLLPSR